MAKNRPTNVRRRNDRLKIKKKKALSMILYGSEAYDNDNQYSKNGIRCSCPKCRKPKYNRYDKYAKGYYMLQDMRTYSIVSVAV